MQQSERASEQLRELATQVAAQAELVKVQEHAKRQWIVESITHVCTLLLVMSMTITGAWLYREHRHFLILERMQEFKCPPVGLPLEQEQQVRPRRGKGRA